MTLCKQGTQTMKQSNLTTPRTLNECHFTPGYTSQGPQKETLFEVIAGYALALVIGIGLAALLVAWWSS
jgi:ABC-type nitrate/sulfonate/bicarbonate transport system permease component